VYLKLSTFVVNSLSYVLLFLGTMAGGDTGDRDDECRFDRAAADGTSIKPAPCLRPSETT
jgi:hypothetical protein